MIKILQNTTVLPISISDVGITVLASSSYIIDPGEYPLFARSLDILFPISVGEIVVSDGTSDLTALNGIAYIQGSFILDQGAKEPKIDVLSIVNASAEYSLVLQNSLKSISLQARNNAELKLSFTNGDIVSGKYFTVHKNCTFTNDGLLFTGKTLYVSSNLPNTEVEVLQSYN